MELHRSEPTSVTVDSAAPLVESPAKGRRLASRAGKTLAQLYRAGASLGNGLAALGQALAEVLSGRRGPTH